MARLGLDWKRGRRVREWALLVALLPSLTFVGHWRPHVDIPGTNLYVGLPAPAGESQPHTHSGQTRDGGDDHASHCHANASSCTDVPYVGASAFALLTESASFIGAAVVLTAVALAAWRPHRTLAIAPEPRPPRLLSSVPS